MRHHILAGIVLGATILAGAAPAGAQTISPERCALIGPATERLNCYDSLFRSSDLAGEASGTSSTGMWSSGVEVSQIEGTERAFAMLQSEQLIPALPRGREPARLTIMCVNEETVAQFSFAGYPLGTATSNSGTITLQYDRQPSRSQSLPLSNDRMALGFFTERDALPFIEVLRETERLYVRAQPQGSRSVTVSFLTEGMEEALQPVREACGW